MHGERGQPLDRGAGRHTATRSALVAGRGRGGLGDARLSGSLGSTTTDAAPAARTAAEQLAGRGARRPGPLEHDGRAASLEQPRQARARRAGDQATPGAAGRAGRAGPGARLLGEAGDPDPVRPAGVDPGLDRGADVVDVHVDVPQAAAADDDQGVAEPVQRGAQRGDRASSGGVEQVHHLVRRAAAGARSPPALGRAGGRAGRARRRRRDRSRSAGDVVPASASQQHHEAPAAGVDHAGPASASSCSGCAASAVAAAPSGAARRRRPGRGIRGRDSRRRVAAASPTVSIVPSTGRPDRGVGLLGGPGQRGAARRRAPAVRLLAQHVGQPRSSWLRMTPELPRAPQQRAAGERVGDRGEVRAVRAAARRAADRGLDGQVQVGARCRRPAPGRR